MALELIYTSAERGLRPGTRGYCTVAYTRGMPPAMVQLLEALSAYKPVFPPHHPREAENPVSVSHYRPTMAGRNASILSRIAPARADATRRSNKLAHHVVLRESECPPAGPAWTAAQPGFFRTSWDLPPRLIEEPKAVPVGEPPPTFAAAWQALTGDAGWAGVLAWQFLSHPGVPAYVLFDPAMEVLPLIGEALALIPAHRRWEVTFSTCFTSLPAGATCVWRCCVPDAAVARDVRRHPRALVIDVTKPLPEPAANPLVRCAREGTPVPDIPGKGALSRGGPGAGSFVVLPGRTRPRIRMGPSLPRSAP